MQIEHKEFLFLAVGDNHMRATGETPKAAALAFLAKYPTKRKPFDVHLVQDYKDAHGTAWRYYLGGPRWKGQTRKTAPSLPETDAKVTDLAAFVAAVEKAPFTFTIYHNGRA